MVLITTTKSILNFITSKLYKTATLYSNLLSWVNNPNTKKMLFSSYIKSQFILRRPKTHFCQLIQIFKVRECKFLDHLLIDLHFILINEIIFFRSLFRKSLVLNLKKKSIILDIFSFINQKINRCWINYLKKKSSCRIFFKLKKNFFFFFFGF